VFLGITYPEMEMSWRPKKCLEDIWCLEDIFRHVLKTFANVLEKYKTSRHFMKCLGDI
jgi:hypothetical protein